jgi:O-antigen ligase
MAFFFLCLYTAGAYIRPQEIYPELAEIPIMQFIVIGAVYTAFMTGRLTFHRLFSAPQNKLILGLLVAITLSHFSQLRISGAKDAFTFFSQTVVFYFLTVSLLDTPKRMELFVRLLTALTLFLSFQGILQYHTGSSWGGQVPIIAHDGVRVRWLGPFSDPNDLALTMLVIVPFLLFSIFSESGRWAKLLSWSCLIMTVYAIYLTKSRGGLLAFCGELYLFFAMRYKGVKAACIGGGVIFGLLMLAPARVTSNIGFSRAFVDYGRIDAWSNGMQMFKSSPLFGVGWARFTEFHPIAAHNSFVEILSEGGLFGSFFWVGLFYVTLRDFYRMSTLPTLSSYDVRGRERGTALVLGIMGFLCASFFLSRAYFFISYIPIAMWVANLRLLFENDSPLDLRFRMQDFMRVALILLGSVIGLYFLVRFFWAMVG